jgi:hypothetical protein
MCLDGGMHSARGSDPVRGDGGQLSTAAAPVTRTIFQDLPGMKTCPARAKWGGRMQSLRRRSVGACLAVLAVGLLVSGCDWTQLGFNSSHNGDNEFDTSITPANVSSSSQQFIASDGTGGVPLPQAVVNGVLYASDSAGLEAYSADGTTGCTASSPATCTPLWSYDTGSLGDSPDGTQRNISVVNGVVYISTSSGLEAFDAAGQKNCSGSPALCQPLWSAPGAFGDPTVSGSTVYVSGSSGLEAFDAAGQKNCAGSPTTCSLLWGYSGPVSSLPTVASGIVYVTVPNDQIIALDAHGVQNCGGTPTTCSPLWYDRMDYQSAVNGYPIVQGNTLYISSGDITGSMRGGFQTEGDLEAFPVEGCGASTCSPASTGLVGGFASVPLVAGDGAVFSAGPLGDGTPFTGVASSNLNDSLWSSTLDAQPMAMAGSVVYAQGAPQGESPYVNDDVYAFDAGGSSGCSGSPVTCAPLWSAPGFDPIVANGIVYVGITNSSSDAEIVAYGLP